MSGTTFRVCVAHCKWPCEDVVLPLRSAKTVEGQRKFGFEFNDSGDVYNGYSWEGKRDGLGVTLYANGDGYAGEWCENNRHGWGFHIKAFGAKYEGSWSNDTQTGFGLQSQSNDLRYFGQFANNKKHGKGVLLQSNGLLYAGEWDNGEPVGRELLFQGFQAADDRQLSPTESCSLPNLARVTGSWDKSPSSLLVALDGGESSSAMPSSSSSSSGPGEDGNTSQNRRESSPVSDRPLEDPKGARDSPFARRFRKVQKLSNVTSIINWSSAEVVHFLSACGIKEDVTDLFLRHKVSGSCLFDILLNANECLVDIGIANPYVRRFVWLTFSTCFKIKHRVEMDRSLSHPPTEPLKDYGISTKGLYLERRVGEGGYGRVYRGRYEFGNSGANQVGFASDASTAASTKADERTARESSIPVAVKVFRSRTLGGSRLRRHADGTADIYGRLQRQQRALLRDFHAEVKILSNLRHPNITLFLGAITFPLFCIVTEYVPCGSLFDLLHRHKRQLSLPQLVRIAWEICCASCYLHSKSIIHCDLKSSNILLNETGSVKLCDFGLATSIASQSEESSSESDPGVPSIYKFIEEKPAMLGCIGTHQWMAPEVMRGEASTKASDVYSFGVILWEMLTGKIPYRDMPLAHIITWVGYGGHLPFEKATYLARAARSPAQHIGPGTLEQGRSVPLDACLDALPQPIKTILVRCLAPTPTHRPTFKQLTAILNDLRRSAVLDVEENLKSFFGLQSPA